MLSQIITVGCAMALTTSGVVARPAARTAFHATDLFALQFARTPVISPDGKTVAYVRERFVGLSDVRVRSLWLIDVKTGRTRRIGEDHKAVSGLRWSPTGDRLAYVSSDTGARARIAVTTCVDGETRTYDSEAGADGIAWSRDGRRIAFTRFVAEPSRPVFPAISRPVSIQRAAPLQVYERSDFVSDRGGYARDGHDQLFVLDLASGAIRQRTRMGTDVADPAWTPDGALIFAAAQTGRPDRSPDDREIWSLDTNADTPVRLTDHDGPDEAPAVSRDGRLIAFTGYDERHRKDTLSRLYVIGRDGSGRRSLTATLDRSVEAAEWTPDGKALVVQYADRGQGRTVARVSLAGVVTPIGHGVTATQVDRPYISEGQFSIADDGTMAFAQSATDRPLEVAVAHGDTVRRITDLNGDLVAARHLATIRPLAVTSPFDGRRIDAWIMLPPGMKPGVPVPAILESHGGPQTAYGPAWGSQFQLFAAAGYAVVFANYRGSGSYGQAFEDLIEDDFPGHAYDDMQGALDAAIATGAVDRTRLYIAGGSAGGAITTWTTGKTDRFRAAAVVKPLIDPRSIALTSDLSRFWLNDWFRATPWGSPARYDSQSPLMLAGAMNTPTVLIVGERDQRTPLGEAVQLYRALQSRGVPTALGIVPDRGHFDLADQPSQLADQTRLILGWFARYGGPPVPAE